MDERHPTALEERPARPEHDRRRQRALQPGKALAGHREGEHWHGQDQADPEAPLHIGKFGIGAGIDRRIEWFERHAAQRAGARFVGADLGMHRAGPDAASSRV